MQSQSNGQEDYSPREPQPGEGSGPPPEAAEVPAESVNHPVVPPEGPGEEDSPVGPPEEPVAAVSASADDEPEGLDEEEEEDLDDTDPFEGDEDEDVAPIEEAPEEEEEELDVPMDWYILKVQSNREKSICDALRRRVAIAGLERYFDEIIVPTEDVAEYRNGKRYVVKKKLYPGYIVVHMAITDDTWFLVRETSGIGDFTGSAGRPTPMLPHEVDRILKASLAGTEEAAPVRTVIPYNVGDRVRIKEGTFENFEGHVENVDEASGRVTVAINIFGRSTPVELEHWQVESV